MPCGEAMPNLPAAISRGITVAVAASDVSPERRAIADALLRVSGSVECLQNEKLMSAATALGGSGPAYLFLLVEALERAGQAAGLPAALSARIASETVCGSSELLRRSGVDAKALRESVTSFGGTTAAAMEILLGDGGFESMLTRAVAARSDELAI
jgi:pyrroline-5-carboxylate reductase